MFRSRSVKRPVIVAIVLLALFAGRLWLGGYFDRQAVWRYPSAGIQAPVSVLLFSGDSGLRMGMGPHVSAALAANGIDTTAISTSTIFRFGADRARLDRIVADAVAGAAKAAGEHMLVVIGQSYGADILQTGLADLPAPLRRKIARIILIVPGRGTYYRPDPTGLLYHLTPDSRSLETASTLRWAPLTCIYGLTDADDLCRSLSLPGITKIGLPGDHYMNHDKLLLATTVLRQVRRALVER